MNRGYVCLLGNAEMRWWFPAPLPPDLGLLYCRERVIQKGCIDMITSRLFELRAECMVIPALTPGTTGKLKILEAFPELRLIRSQHGGLASKMQLL